MLLHRIKWCSLIQASNHHIYTSIPQRPPSSPGSQYQYTKPVFRLRPPSCVIDKVGFFSPWIRTYWLLPVGNPYRDFTEVCTVAADLQNLKGILERKYSATTGVYWKLGFQVCIRFGGTEISAYLEWVQNVSLLDLSMGSIHWHVDIGEDHDRSCDGHPNGIDMNRYFKDVWSEIAVNLSTSPYQCSSIAADIRRLYLRRLDKVQCTMAA